MTMLLIVSFTSLSSCCNEGSIFPASHAYITFIDRNLSNSVFKSPYSFPKDSLKVLNEKGEEQVFEFRGPNHTILLYDLYNDQVDQLAVSQELCKKYMFQFLYTEIDTVTVCYLAGDRECGATLFSYVKVYSENDSTTYQTAENIIIKK